MKSLCLILLFHASVQLECNHRRIHGRVGEEFTLVCHYDTSRFLFSKKYWCRGDSRTTCEILMDCERFQQTDPGQRVRIVDLGRRGVIVKLTALRLEDTGVYWVGIDKVYADIMVSINVVVSEVPVSEPKVWPLNSLVGTCWGQPVTVRCGCTRGTGVDYKWYQHNGQQETQLNSLSDLYLHCSRIKEDSHYYCDASNSVNSQRSDMLSVQVLAPAVANCVYVINIPDQPVYDCRDRLRTSPMSLPPSTTCQTTEQIHNVERGNQSIRISEEDQDLLQSRAWTGLPYWYTLLRWISFVLLLTSLCLACRYRGAYRC